MAMHSPQPAQSNPLLIGICITAVAAGATAGVAIIVHSCRPRYYCLWDSDNKLKLCRQTTRKAAIISGYDVLLGPFDDDKACQRACVTNNIPVPITHEVYIDPPMFIERSTDLVHWTVAQNITGEVPEALTWGETNRVDRTCFYRVKLLDALIDSTTN